MIFHSGIDCDSDILSSSFYHTCTSLNSIQRQAIQKRAYALYYETYKVYDTVPSYITVEKNNTINNNTKFVKKYSLVWALCGVVLIGNINIYNKHIHNTTRVDCEFTFFIFIACVYVVCICMYLELFCRNKRMMFVSSAYLAQRG